MTSFLWPPPRAWSTSIEIPIEAFIPEGEHSRTSFDARLRMDSSSPRRAELIVVDKEGRVVPPEARPKHLPHVLRHDALQTAFKIFTTDTEWTDRSGNMLGGSYDYGERHPHIDLDAAQTIGVGIFPRPGSPVADKFGEGRFYVTFDGEGNITSMIPSFVAFHEIGTRGRQAGTATTEVIGEMAYSSQNDLVQTDIIPFFDYVRYYEERHHTVRYLMVFEDRDNNSTVLIPLRQVFPRKNGKVAVTIETTLREALITLLQKPDAPADSDDISRPPRNWHEEAKETFDAIRGQTAGMDIDNSGAPTAAIPLFYANPYVLHFVENPAYFDLLITAFARTEFIGKHIGVSRSKGRRGSAFSGAEAYITFAWAYKNKQINTAMTLTDLIRVGMVSTDRVRECANYLFLLSDDPQ